MRTRDFVTHHREYLYLRCIFFIKSLVGIWSNWLLPPLVVTINWRTISALLFNIAILYVFFQKRASTLTFISFSRYIQRRWHRGWHHFCYIISCENRTFVRYFWIDLPRFTPFYQSSTLKRENSYSLENSLRAPSVWVMIWDVFAVDHNVNSSPCPWQINYDSWDSEVVRPCYIRDMNSWILDNYLLSVQWWYIFAMKHLYKSIWCYDWLSCHSEID